MSKADMLPDGCFPEHDPTKSYCSEFKGRKSPYPRFPSLDDLVQIDELAKQMGVSRRSLADARFETPALPYFRMGGKMLISKTQLVWWLNELQDTQVDKYFIERRRRLAAGIVGKPPVKPKGGSRATTMAKARK